VVSYNLSVLHGSEDAKPQRVSNQDYSFLESHDVIGHVTIGLGVGTFMPGVT